MSLLSFIKIKHKRLNVGIFKKILKNTTKIFILENKQVGSNTYFKKEIIKT